MATNAADSKTIMALQPYDPIMGEVIKDFYLPVQYMNGNLRVSVRDIIGLITKAYLGLEKVNNTTDMEKPVSQLQQQALDGKANSSHEHSINDIDDLESRLNEFREKTDNIPMDEVEGLQQALQEFLPKDYRPSMEDVVGLVEKLEAIEQSIGNISLNDIQGWSAFEDALNEVLSQCVRRDEVEGIAENVVQQAMQNAVIDRPDLSDW